MVDLARYEAKEARKAANVRRLRPFSLIGVVACLVAFSFTTYRFAVNTASLALQADAFFATFVAFIMVLIGGAVLIGWRRWFKAARSVNGLIALLIVTTVYVSVAFSGVLVPGLR